MLMSLALALLLSLDVSPRQQDCPCEKFVFTGSVPTSHMINYTFERKPFRQIQGGVTNINGTPPEEKAFIFVSRLPENISGKDYFSGEYGYRRSLIACETLMDGKFCFKNIRPGKYEVCATSRGYNNTCVLITVSRRSKRSNLNIALDVGI